MDIKQALLTILGESHSTKPLAQNRRNIIRSRNSQKTPLIQQADPSNQHYYLFKPANQKANAMAMKYVQSHHPCIKDRVVKILSHHRHIPTKANNETIILDFPNDDKLTCTSASRKQSFSTITHKELNQRQNQEKHNHHLSLLQMYISQYQASNHVKQAQLDYSKGHKINLEDQRRFRQIHEHRFRTDSLLHKKSLTRRVAGTQLTKKMLFLLAGSPQKLKTNLFFLELLFQLINKPVLILLLISSFPESLPYFIFLMLNRSDKYKLLKRRQRENND